MRCYVCVLQKRDLHVSAKKSEAVPDYRTDELVPVYRTSPYAAEAERRGSTVPPKLCIGFVCEGGELDPRACLAEAIFRKYILEEWGETL